MTVIDDITSMQGPSAATGMLPLERLEARIVELAGQIAAASCEFLTLVGEFDAAEGWRSWEMGSTAAWLAWKCGLGMEAARQQVRVARRMREFPRLVELFRAGRLSYSKVRSITRGATEETIELFIEWALTCTAAELERLVAAHRRCSPADGRKRHATRSMSYRWAEDGSLVGSFRIPPEQAAVFLTAIEAAKATLADPEPDQEAAADASIPACEQCRESAAAGHGDCDGSAAAHRRFAHLDGSAETSSCPDLIDAVARAGCPDVDPTALAQHARDRTTATALLRLAELGLAAAEAGRPATDPERYMAVIHVTGKLSGQIEDHPPLSNATTDRLTCSCGYLIQTDDPHGNPLHLGRKTRRIRTKLARAVHRRDGGRCRAPGCNRHTTQIHHVWHWRHGGPTCIENLISLCDSHHWLVHDGGWEITVLAPGRWLFQRADGTAVPATGSPPLHLAPLPHDTTVATDAITPAWPGPRALDDAVWLLGSHDDATDQERC